MKVLLTGGSGVVGRGVIPPLLRAGHRVRLLSRGADDAALEWPEGVEAFPADVCEPGELLGAAEGCGCVIHLAGIVVEQPPGVTFEGVNVEGTRNVVLEAERCEIGRFVYVSSLGAHDGTSKYHCSKFEAEQVVRRFPGEWLIVRPSAVFGPGDEMVSALLAMVRSAAAVPLIEGGEQPFQPLWYEDLGEALAKAVDEPTLAYQTLELVGPEITTTRDLVEGLAKITDRTPVRLSIPASLAAAGAQIAVALGVELPINESKLATLVGEGVRDERSGNALGKVFGVTPTPIYTALGRLADEQLEQPPSEGVGDLEYQRFWANIEGSELTAPELLERFRTGAADILPVALSAEPGAPREIEQGRTLTLNVPFRGHVQMRVEQVTERQIVLATLRGHPQAGIVLITADPVGERVRFQVAIYARPATPADWLGMRTLGEPVQRWNWNRALLNVIDLSGGTAPGGVECEATTLDESAAQAIDAWIRERIAERRQVAAAGV